MSCTCASTGPCIERAGMARSSDADAGAAWRCHAITEAAAVPWRRLPRIARCGRALATACKGSSSA
eukprot:15678056-Heterocapsa_arctica.AAC.1